MGLLYSREDKGKKRAFLDESLKIYIEVFGSILNLKKRPKEAVTPSFFSPNYRNSKWPPNVALILLFQNEPIFL